MKKTISIRTITQVALFVAVTALLAQIAFPLPSGVPVTLQTLAIALCGYVLGWKLALVSTGVYALLGLVGVPVFAQLQSGPGTLFGPTGGFIWGFFALAGLCGAGLKLKIKPLAILLGLAGLAVCHTLGVLQFALVTKRTILQSFLLVSVPYLIKDALSIAGAFGLGFLIRNALKKTGLLPSE